MRMEMKRPACLPARSCVRRSDAEAPVYVRGQQPPPGACRTSPEHLVQAAGTRTPGSVRGRKRQRTRRCRSANCFTFLHDAFPPALCSTSAAGRPPSKSCSLSIQRSTCFCLAPAPSTASNWTTASWPVITNVSCLNVGNRNKLLYLHIRAQLQ